MSTVEAIENAIEQLGKKDLAALRAWFATYDAAQWDVKLEQDIQAGKLDSLANEAVSEYQAGKTKKL